MPRRRALKKRTRTMAHGQEYDIWERGRSGKEALVINSIETHIGAGRTTRPIKAALNWTAFVSARENWSWKLRYFVT
jgi:hypothetical protein